MTATALETELLRTIGAEGPVTLDRYMALCLGHASYGYYMTRDPFGAAGDFVTAPEVTQMFGEMVGVWCAAVFELIGRPRRFDLIELGPGRGTLMADILRSAKVMPGFLAAARVRLVEMSARLRDIQNATLRPWQAVLGWHDRLDQIGAGPAIVIANEFFDALPVKQFRYARGQWSERVVAAGDGGLCLGWNQGVPPPTGRLAECANGDILEIRPAASELASGIAGRLMNDPGAALIIDYGHMRSCPGDTLQAVRRHRMVAILDQPGESDLTAHVDFQSSWEGPERGGSASMGAADPAAVSARHGIGAARPEPEERHPRRSDK